MQLEEVALHVQLVAVAVEEGEDGRQLGRRVGGQLHLRRLVRLNHAIGPRAGSGVPSRPRQGGGRVRRRRVLVIEALHQGLRGDGVGVQRSLGRFVLAVARRGGGLLQSIRGVVGGR